METLTTFEQILLISGLGWIGYFIVFEVIPAVLKDMTGKTKGLIAFMREQFRTPQKRRDFFFVIGLLNVLVMIIYFSQRQFN